MALLSRRQQVSGTADPFNGHIDEFRIAHVQRSDCRIETTWNNMSDPGAFGVTGAEEQEGGEPPPLAGAGVVSASWGEGGHSVQAGQQLSTVRVPRGTVGSC